MLPAMVLSKSENGPTRPTHGPKMGTGIKETAVRSITPVKFGRAPYQLTGRYGASGHGFMGPPPPNLFRNAFSSPSLFRLEYAAFVPNFLSNLILAFGSRSVMQVESICRQHPRRPLPCRIGGREREGNALSREFIRGRGNLFADVCVIYLRQNAITSDFFVCAFVRFLQIPSASFGRRRRPKPPMFRRFVAGDATNRHMRCRGKSPMVG